ncbi:MAG: hypothetical protein HRU17_19225 [Polyangiaceae bacterium]|nr:hypothetical protein [Polyangiaceae bacterium]
MLALTSCRRGALFGVCLAVTTPASVRAGECGKPDLLHSAPVDGAVVPLNASLRAYYASSAELIDEDVTIQPEGDSEAVAVAAEFSPNEGILSFEPDFLEEGKAYTLSWPELRGFGTATRGEGRTLNFDVSGALDQDPPEFVGVSDVVWDLRRQRDPCTESDQDRYEFLISLSPADDDGGRENLTLQIFQSRGPRIRSPSSLGHLPLPASGDPAIVNLALNDAIGEVCFAAQVLDLRGQTSTSLSQEVCVTTVGPPFFYGCSLSPMALPVGSSLEPLSCGFGWLIALGFRRRRRAG